MLYTHVFKPVLGGRYSANLWDRQTDNICIIRQAVSMGGTLVIALKGR